MRILFLYIRCYFASSVSVLFCTEHAIQFANLTFGPWN